MTIRGWTLSLLSAALSGAAMVVSASFGDPHVWREGIMTGDWSGARNLALSGAVVGLVNFLIHSPLASVLIEKTTETHTVEKVTTPAPAEITAPPSQPEGEK